MQYVGMEDGTVISGDRATEIRKFAHAIWVSFSKTGGPPSKWGQADIQIRQQYLYAMGSHFPELRLCDLEWKSEQIATDNYLSWYTNWLSKHDVQGPKQENDDVPSLQTKRSREASVKSAAKRTKLEEAAVSDDKGGNGKVEGVPTSTDRSASDIQMDASPTLDTDMLDAGITTNQSTYVSPVVPVNASYDDVPLITFQNMSNPSNPDPNIATNEPVTKDNTAASPTIEDLSKVPSITMNELIANSRTAEKF
ncbi:hypothetical protein BYT27DRAFT_7131552, partial [Phlegmacium glaucopus]